MMMSVHELVPLLAIQLYARCLHQQSIAHHLSYKQVPSPASDEPIGPIAAVDAHMLQHK